MVRPILCSLLLAAFLLMGSSTAPPASASGPVQGTLGQPMQVGPWLVTVERAYRSHWHAAPALVVLVRLRNRSNTTQPLDSSRFFTCYRNDVWAAVDLRGGDPLPGSAVAPGKETFGRLIYQLPPDVSTFGLVAFWQTTGASATGIWLLDLSK